MAQEARRGSITLADWKHHAVTKIPLASGAGEVWCRGAYLAELIRVGRIPNPLMEMAIRAEYQGLDPATLSAEEVQAYEDLKDAVVAACVTEPTLEPADVRDLPGEDREQLWRAALHGAEVATWLASFRDGRSGDGAASDGTGDGQAPE